MATPKIGKTWMIIGKGLLLLAIILFLYWVIYSHILYKTATQIIKILNSDLEYVTYFEYPRAAFTALIIPVILFNAFHFDTRKKQKRIPKILVKIFIIVLPLSVIYITQAYTAISGSELVVRDLYLNKKQYPIDEISFKINESSGRCHSRGNSHPCIKTHLILMHQGQELLTDNDSRHMFSDLDPFAPSTVFLSELINRGAMRSDEE